MATTIKSRFPLLLLLGIVFLSSACVSYGIAHYEQGNPCYEKCLQRYNRVNGALKHHECRCEEEEEEEERSERRVPGQRERGRQEGERAEERREKHHEQSRHSHDCEEDEREERQPQRERGRQEGEREEERREKHNAHGWEEDEREERQPQRERGRQEGEREEEREEQEDEEWRGRHRHEDPDERARMRYRKERREEQKKKESQKTDRRRHSEQEGEEEEGSSSSQGRRNPFFFRSNKFQTVFENENGYIRLLQRFDKCSNLFQNLQNYRLVEYRARPQTIFLPHHIDADFILVVLDGRAILTLLNSNDRNSFNLERGDTIKLPAGTIAYIVNQDENEDLRVVELVVPINRPGKFQSFDIAGGQNKQSYFRGFSKSILEASFNAKYEDIEKVLLEEQEHEPQHQRRGHKGRQQSQEVDAIVKVSREQIEELRRHAKSSSKRSASSESEPFNLRNRNPDYSNNFGKFFEATPEKNPQLKDLDMSISSVEINEGALLLPHYNSRAIVVLMVNEGKGNLELVGPNSDQQEQEQDEEEQQEQEEEQEQNKQVRRYKARLSRGDVVVIPAGHPVAVEASSDLYLLGFGINAENNQRNFLAGEDDNVISQIERPVKEVAFPGSAQEVDRLIKNQRQSHFANARPQQKEEGKSHRRGPLLSSILGTFY